MMFINDSKTSLRVITEKDSPTNKDIIPSSPGIYKRSSAPDRYDMLDGSPFSDGKHRNHDLRPTVPVRRFSKHNSEAAKDVLEMRASFLSELLLVDASIQDDFDDETSITESSVVSDITNPTFFPTGRTESGCSIDTYFSEAAAPPVEYQRLSSSSGSKDLPPRPAARELTASSQDFETSIENSSTSFPPPMPPAPRPFAPERHIIAKSSESPVSERDEVQDKDTPPRPFSRRLTESNLTDVAHAHQFKDANLFYRFSRRCDCDSSSTTSDDASFASMGSLLVALQRRDKGSYEVKPMQISVSSRRKSPLRSSLRLVGSSEVKQEGRAVTFGSVDERVYERTLEMHPATRSGPSIGLGWKYEDKPTMPLSNEATKGTSSRNKKDFLLSSNTRKNLLCEWGHSKIEMFLASRVNEKIREQRKRSLNKITVKTFDTEAMPCRASPFPSFR